MDRARCTAVRRMAGQMVLRPAALPQPRRRDSARRRRAPAPSSNGLPRHRLGAGGGHEKNPRRSRHLRTRPAERGDRRCVSSRRSRRPASAIQRPAPHRHRRRLARLRAVGPSDWATSILWQYSCSARSSASGLVAPFDDSARGVASTNPEHHREAAGPRGWLPRAAARRCSAPSATEQQPHEADTSDRRGATGPRLEETKRSGGQQSMRSQRSG